MIKFIYYYLYYYYYTALRLKALAITRSESAEKNAKRARVFLRDLDLWGSAIQKLDKGSTLCK